MKELLAMIFGLAIGGLLVTIGLQFDKIPFDFFGFGIMGVTLWTGLRKINKIQKLEELNEKRE